MKSPFDVPPLMRQAGTALDAEEGTCRKAASIVYEA